MIKKLFIFDLDGTLINSRRDIITSFNYAFKKNKCKKITNSFFLKNANQGSKYFIGKNLNTKNKYKISKIQTDFIKHYEQNCINNTKLRVGVKFFLEWSRNKSLNIISTNKSEILTRKILRKLKILKYFKKIYGFNSLKYNKPNKLHLLKILQIHNYNQSSCFFWGDSYIDYIMTKKANVNFILINKGYNNKTINIDRSKKINNFFQGKKVINNLL
jgi:phosphoglycolate phosphatase